MNAKFLIVILILVRSIFCDEFFSCIQTCASIIDKRDLNQKTEVTLTADDLRDFKSYLQRFFQHYYENYHEWVFNVIPDESEKLIDEEESCRYGDRSVCCD
jgi:hypothetical protein